MASVAWRAVASRRPRLGPSFILPRVGGLPEAKQVYSICPSMLQLTPSAEHLLDLARRDAATRGQNQSSFRNVVLSALDLGPDGPLAAAYGERGFSRKLRTAMEMGLPPRRTTRAEALVPIDEWVEERLAREQHRLGRVDVHALMVAVCDAPVVRAFLDESRFAVSDLLETAYDASVLCEAPLWGGAMSAPDMSRFGDSTAQRSESLITRFGRDLTEVARSGRGHRAVGRERELSDVCGSLLRMQQNNPILIGLPGTGKTAIVEHLAVEIAEGRLGPEFEGVRLVEIDLPGLVAGTRFRGDFEERIKGVIAEVRAAKGRIIPFIDEIHLLMGAGSGAGGMDAANILKPPLARGELRLIGATTPEEYRTTIAKDPALARRFGPVKVDPPSEAATLEIVKALSLRIGKHHGLSVRGEQCRRAVELAGRYIRQRNFPDKAILVLDQAAALHRVRAQAEGRSRESGEPLCDEHVYEAVERLSGVPASRLAKGEAERLEGVRRRLEERIIGQPRAVEAVMRVLRRRAAALAPEERPVGSFLFLGPSGVGKTELARVVAEEYFDSPHAIERFDMSEHVGLAGSASLLGAPAGTIGSDRGGALTNALQRNPFAVYLFDEIEKADRSIMNIFLQMLDAGRITGRDGVTTDCSHAVVIFTSNLGQREALEREERTPEQSAEVHLDAARRHLPPELFRRFDEVVAFHALSREACTDVARLGLRNLSKRFLRAHSHHLDFDEAVAQALGEVGHSPLYGARNVRYEMERRVEEPLVGWILGQATISGPVRGRWEGGTTSYSVEEAR